jgi:hypothetical protein
MLTPQQLLMIVAKHQILILVQIVEAYENLVAEHAVVKTDEGVNLMR